MQNLEKKTTLSIANLTLLTANKRPRRVTRSKTGFLTKRSHCTCHCSPFLQCHPSHTYSTKTELSLNKLNQSNFPPPNRHCVSHPKQRQLNYARTQTLMNGESEASYFLLTRSKCRVRSRKTHKPVLPVSLPLARGVFVTVLCIYEQSLSLLCFRIGSKACTGIHFTQWCKGLMYEARSGLFLCPSREREYSGL